MYRGSRKHILDWTSRPTFITEILRLADPIRCSVNSASEWQPRGYQFPNEARLDSFGPRVYPDHPAWSSLTSWWLKHARGANTPNWDVALSCEVEGRPGLILVEAKANVPELSGSGKSFDSKSSQSSQENHDQIKLAINEARQALASTFPAITIDRDKHYQLSNRISFAWKLASSGIPVVLIYLGFIGDEGISDVGLPFATSEHWESVFDEYMRGVCPDPMLDHPIDCGEACFWVLSRTLPVFENSERAAV